MRRHTVYLLALLLISSAALGQNLKLEKHSVLRCRGGTVHCDLAEREFPGRGV